MILKILGSVLVIIASSAVGYYISFTKRKRVADIEDFISAFIFFRNEVEYSSQILSKVFKQTSKVISKRVAIFFNETGVLIEENKISASDTWKMIVKKNHERLYLDNTDIDILYEFGEKLGVSYIEGHLSNITLIIEKLKIQLERAKAEYNRNGKMFRILGIISGITLVIVLV